jgi:thiol:disulfide interchange protein DsbD
VAGVLTIWQLAQIGAGAPPAQAATAAVSAPSATFAPRPAPTAAMAAGSGTAPAAVAPPERAASADGGSADWQPWSPQRVAQSLAQGRPVMVDFTAAWCISCQANKKFVLERDVVRRAFQDREVTLLRADWTRRDPAITAELATFGRNGVPLYLVYRAAGELPLMLPELLTVDIVLAALADGR